MVLASTRLAAVECDSVACAICDSRTTVLSSPTGMSPERRHLADGLTGPGRVEFDVGIHQHRDHGPAPSTWVSPAHRVTAAASCAAHRRPRQHDVVDIAVIAGAHQAVVRQGAAGHRESAVPRHRGVQRAAGGGAASDGAGDVGEPAPDLDPLTGVVRAEDFDPPLALIAGCSVQHIAHPCRLSRCLTSHLPTTLQQMMHTCCIRGGTPGPC